MGTRAASGRQARQAVHLCSQGRRRAAFGCDLTEDLGYRYPDFSDTGEPAIVQLASVCDRAFAERYDDANGHKRRARARLDEELKLIDELGRLPGVGPKGAQRIAFHLLTTDPDDVARLAHALTQIKDKVRFCEICGNVAEAEQCRICLDPRRDAHLICVVEQSQDVAAVERTREFRGRYHVLGGALSPIDGIEPEDLKLAQLYTRVDDGVREIILATNQTTTGEATALHVAAALHERAPEVAVTRLASGLPVGGDLEYADEVTLGRAFAGRRAV